MTHNRHLPTSTTRHLAASVSKHRSALADAYDQVIRQVPFSSIAQVYECLAASAPDLRFGRSCIGQSLELGRLLRERDLGETGYLRGLRHVAISCTWGEHRYLLDPFLLHPEPIDLGMVIAKRRLEVRSYPLDDKRLNGRLALRSYRSGMLVLASYAYDRSAGMHRLRRHFKIALEPQDDELSLPPAQEIASLLFCPEQTTLSLRVVTSTSGLLEIVYPLAVYHGSGVVEESQLLMCENDDVLFKYEERRQFETLLSSFCREIRASRSEVIEHVLGGVQLYENHAPMFRPSEVPGPEA